MASYPSAVKVFVTRSAGQTIDPSHVNDLQDEVNAIEAGLLNGTARIQSSNASVANLTVAGGSTFTGAVVLPIQNSIGSFTYRFPSSGPSTGQVLTAITTSGSTVTMEWRGAGSTGNPAVKVQSTTAAQVAAQAWTGMNYQVEVFDTDAMFSTGTNSSRITFTNSTGVYAIGAAVTFSAVNNTSGVRGVRLLFNDVTGSPALETFTPAEASTNPQTLIAATIVQVTSTGDYVTCQVWSNTGSTTSIPANNGGRNNFWAYRVRG